MYNHHQTGPAGTVMFAPPFRDPFNFNFDPLDLDRHRHRRRGDGQSLRCGREAGLHDAQGLELLDVVERRPADDGYFHNMIGLLTETIGNPTPVSIPFVPRSSCRAFESALPDRTAADVAFPPVDRLLGHRELRGVRCARRATRTHFSTTST